jgi:undecaprenyl-diphosphatase
MGIFESIILGFVQGLTEFLPVSSTGHLILARDLFGMESSHDLAFDAILHLATALAVVVYFYKDIMMLINTALRKLSRLPVNQSDFKLLVALLVGTIPAVVLGLLLESTMETLFRSPLLVAGVLVAGSFLFIYAEWVYMHSYPTNDINVKKGFKIGLFQALALIPGMSRAGATISGGMLLGLTRPEAARFAFLLAVPVITGAGLKKLLDLIVSDGQVSWGVVGIGAATAFVTGLLAVHFMLAFVRRHTLWPFIWYRMILASLVVFIYVFG